VCFDFLYNVCLKRFSSYEETSEILSKMYIGIHVKHPLFLSDINETWIFFRQISEKYSNIKFYENPSSGSQVVQCDRRTDGRTDLTKLIVTIGNFANTPKTDPLSNSIIQTRGVQHFWQRAATFIFNWFAGSRSKILTECYKNPPKLFFYQ